MTALEPIPMLLACPTCGERHIDVGDFATRLHHTHACQYCGNVWRPAVVATVGVQFLPGFKNDTSPDEGCPDCASMRRQVARAVVDVDSAKDMADFRIAEAMDASGKVRARDRLIVVESCARIVDAWLPNHQLADAIRALSEDCG